MFRSYLGVLVLVLALVGCSGPSIDLDDVEPLMRNVMDRHDQCLKATPEQLAEWSKSLTPAERADYLRSTEILRHHFATVRAEEALKGVK